MATVGFKGLIEKNCGQTDRQNDTQTR